MLHADIISRYRAFLLDVDGVLIRGAAPLPGTADALATLRARGSTLLLTNNSSRTRAQSAERLRGFGFQVESDDVMTTSRIAALYLREECQRVRFWPLGEEGLIAELEAEGHLRVAAPEEADWVVAGIDRQLSYDRLAEALVALRAGAKLLATNTDPTFPVPGGVLPGAGAIVGALQGMGFPVDVNVGKPSAYAYRIALNQLGSCTQDVLMIGDRLETDIDGGRQAGLDTALVLTGVTDRKVARASGIRPTWVAESLPALVAGDVEPG